MYQYLPILGGFYIILGVFYLKIKANLSEGKKNTEDNLTETAREAFVSWTKAIESSAICKNRIKDIHFKKIIRQKNAALFLNRFTMVLEKRNTEL